MLDEKGSRKVHALGVDYSHLINQAGSPEPLQLIRSNKRIIQRLFSLSRVQRSLTLMPRRVKGFNKQVNALI